MSITDIDSRSIVEIAELFELLGEKAIVDDKSRALIEIENHGIDCILAESMTEAGAREI